MTTPKKPIEYNFHETLLKVGLIGILVVMAVDLVTNKFFEPLSLIVNATIFLAIVGARILYKRGQFTFSVLLVGFLLVASMCYQSVVGSRLPVTSMAVILLAGFTHSVLLKGRITIIIHLVTLAAIIAVFTWQWIHPQDYSITDPSDVTVVAVTYIILYSIIAYASFILRRRYDEALSMLAVANGQLIEKSNEIEAQNEELLQSQEHLAELNTDLEKIVQDRTLEITKQNERLIRYAHTNAHHLRGPVARALGLIQLFKQDSDMSYPELFLLIEEQVLEIDVVVKDINKELAT